MMLSPYAAITAKNNHNTWQNMVSAPVFHAESNGVVGGPLSSMPTDVFTATTAAAAIFRQSTAQHVWALSRRGNDQSITLQ
jgi:hypothetical protein